METVDIQWPSSIETDCGYTRGFGGVCHKKFSKFTPVAHWQQAEAALVQAEETLGPNPPQEEAKQLHSEPPPASQLATQEELKLNHPILPPAAKKKKTTAAKKKPDIGVENFSIFAKKHLRTV